MTSAVQCKDHTFPQLSCSCSSSPIDAADRIYRAIVAARRLARGTAVARADPPAYDTVGSTRYVDFDTIRPRTRPRADKCHVSHVVADSDVGNTSWPSHSKTWVKWFAYVKNQSLGFTIPYTFNGDEHQYCPDFLVRIDDGRGRLIRST